MVVPEVRSSTQYKFILTDVGEALETEAKVQNKPIKLVQVGFGDGNGSEYIPEATQTSLVHEVYRKEIDYKRKDEENLDTTLIGVVLPMDIGGFYIREMGIYAESLEEEGELVLYAVGNHPPFFKSNNVLGQATSVEIEIPLTINSSQDIEIIVKDTGYAELVKRVSNIEKWMTENIGGGVINDEVIITESGQWSAPFTGYYEIYMMSGGNGAQLRRTGAGYNEVVSGMSGCYKEIIKFYNAGTVVDVTIGAGGKGDNQVETGILSDIYIGGDTIFDGISCAALKVGVYSRNNFVNDGYTYFSGDKTKARGSGAGRGAGMSNSKAELNTAAWYGAGGGGINYTNSFVTAGDGGQGVVIIRFHNPEKWKAVFKKY